MSNSRSRSHPIREAEALVHQLQLRGYHVVAAVEQIETGRLGTVRLSTRDVHGGPVVDLLFASSGIEPEIVAAAEPTEVLPGLVVPVACVGDLIAMKLLARDDESNRESNRPEDVRQSVDFPAGKLRHPRPPATIGGRESARQRERPA